MCGITHASREHERHSQCLLKKHLLQSGTSSIVKRENGSLRPMTTFSEQGHLQKHWCSGGGESDADPDISIVSKAPFQSGADVGETSEIRLPLRRVCYNQT